MVFHPTPSFVSFMKSNINTIPRRTARRAFIERFAPTMMEHLLFLEPEEEDALQEIMTHEECVDVYSMSSRMTELQYSLNSLPELYVPGNPLSSLTLDKLYAALAAEVDNERRIDVILILIISARKCIMRPLREHDDEHQRLEMIMELETLFASIMVDCTMPTCVRLAVALSGACDMEALLLARQVPLDDVAVEYYRQRLPVSIGDLIVESIATAGSRGGFNSVLVDVLLTNLVEHHLHEQHMTLLGNLTHCDAVALICCAHVKLELAPAHNLTSLNIATERIAQETDDELSAARRFTLLCHILADQNPVDVMHAASAVLGTRDECSYMHAQVLVNLLQRDATRAAVIEYVNATYETNNITALLVALHAPDEMPAALGILVTPAFNFLNDLPARAQAFILKGAMHALLDRGMINMLHDRQVAIDLLVRIFNAYASAVERIKSVSDDCDHDQLPFDFMLGIVPNLFPQCSHGTVHDAFRRKITPLFSDDWNFVHKVALTHAIAPDGDMGDIVRRALTHPSNEMHMSAYL